MSGASSYRKGEFLYQDFLYDDTALPYPSDPRHARNAADIVELRVKPLEAGLALRLTYNTLLDPEAAATTIALGSSSQPRTVPHGAGASMLADVFVTVHGCSVHVQSSGDLHPLPAGTVGIDRERRQVHVTVPYQSFDPRGRRAVRIAAATGLWDAAAGAYYRPDRTKPAFYNVAFRFREPVSGMRDTHQNAALVDGDVRPFAAHVDFVKLASGEDDDMPDRPTGVPVTGQFARLFPSRFETAQGRGNFGFNATVYRPCHPPCSPPLAGRLQPYGVYVPKGPQPEAGWGLALYHHGSGDTYNTFLGRAARFADLDGGSTIAIAPESRGPDIWEYEQAGADLYEAWADAARNYRLDPDRTTISGQSLGGYATWKNVVQFPDLFSAAAPNVAPPTASGLWPGPPVPPYAGEGTLVYSLLPSLRHVPVVHWVGIQDELVPFGGTQPISDILDRLRYRHSFRAFTGDHITTGTQLANYDPQAAYIANRRVVRNPARVTYVFSAFMHQPEYGLTSDHAYWLSGLALRDTSGDAPIGTVDAYSHGLGAVEPQPAAPKHSAGAYPTRLGGAPVPYYGTDLAWQWPTRAADKQDRLDIAVTNLRAVTVDVRRAGLTCQSVVKVVSDGPVEVTKAGCSRRSAAPIVTVHPAPSDTASADLPATGPAAAAAVGIILLGLAAVGHRRSVHQPPRANSSSEAARPVGRAQHRPDARDCG